MREVSIIQNVVEIVLEKAIENKLKGNDKPLKYPLMFEKSGAVILNKLDLIKFTNFDKEEFYKDIKSLNANADIFETSCTKNQGIDEICLWLKDKIKGGSLLCQE